MMKELLIRIIILFVPISGWASPVYDDFFTDQVLRYDYLLSGNHTLENVIPCEIKKEKMWGGSHNALIDRFNYGTYRFMVYDDKSGELIFSKGFSPLFQEWQMTAEAKVSNKAFYQVIRFPFPKKPIRLKIEKRNYNGQFSEIFSTNINPDNYFIINENSRYFPVKKIIDSGDPAHKIDIAILAEGYTENEMDKFVKDAQRLTDSLFVVAPFSQMKDYFNVYTVETPSYESGTDIPGEHIFRNTLYNSTFYTFNISRYLTTSDMKSACDMAAGVPYDQIYVLVNSSRYGGGGFYNFITVCTSDHLLSPKVFVHEFGHGFAGLADEYYTSEVAYDNYYNLKVEPWEPNLTTMVDFSTKWKDMIDATTPVPTPRNEKYASKVGVFEGGGYESKGIFSPMENCRMKSNETSKFCPVCQKAIKEVILENTK